MEEDIISLQNQIKLLKEDFEDFKRQVLGDQFQLKFPLDVVSQSIIKNTAEQKTKVKYYLSANQTISTATWTKIQFDTKVYDKRGEFDNTTNYRFNVTEAGYYLIIGKAQLDSASTAGDTFYLDIYKNGSSVSSIWVVAPGLYKIYAFIASILDLEAGDYIELYAQQDTGANQSIVGGSKITTIEIYKLI